MTIQRKQPVASVGHTLVLTGILLAIAVEGAMFQASPAPTSRPPDPMALYLSLLAGELLLCYAVWRGIRRTGTRLGDLIGGRWVTPRAVVSDAVRGGGLWVALSGVSWMWDHLAPFGHAARAIAPLLPRGGAAIVAWIGLSIAAGVVEEIVFRGYYQRQFEAWTQRPWTALLMQALLFGVAHGYQGVGASLKIALIGLGFGAMALGCRTLRPGILAHAWTDIASGVFRI